MGLFPLAKGTWFSMVMHEYQIMGRMKPSVDDPEPKVYRMKLFAKNDVCAKSKFWYFISRLRRIKTANGQILSCHEIFEKHPDVVKNYGIWFRYESRTGTHNAYKEYRAMTLCEAVNTLYQDFAGRNRAMAKATQIMRTAIVKPKEARRLCVTTFHDSKISFPLPHRVLPSERKFKSLYKAQKPCTFF